ncbi:hypothetical protein [Burkholderia territorii]|uniref:hypothetical protein n=1 Tax=Burkholderia territorii TaxID=1503055 RepID=UPI0012D8DE31|nr:hypothetical protein [Burkholderia territorii]
MSDDDDHGSQGSSQLQVIFLISERGSQLYPTLNECIGDVLAKDEVEHVCLLSGASPSCTQRQTGQSGPSVWLIWVHGNEPSAGAFELGSTGSIVHLIHAIIDPAF